MIVDSTAYSFIKGCHRFVGLSHRLFCFENYVVLVFETMKCKSPNINNFYINCHCHFTGPFRSQVNSITLLVTNAISTASIYRNCLYNISSQTHLFGCWYTKQLTSHECLIMKSTNCSRHTRRKARCRSPFWENIGSTKTCLRHWGRDKMAEIYRTTCLNAFSWNKMYEIR